MGDLPYVHQSPEYISANPGLAFDYQFINVEDFMGRVRGVGCGRTSGCGNMPPSFESIVTTVSCEFYVCVIAVACMLPLFAGRDRAHTVLHPEPWGGGVHHLAVLLHAPAWLPCPQDHHPYHVQRAEGAHPGRHRAALCRQSPSREALQGMKDPLK